MKKPKIRFLIFLSLLTIGFPLLSSGQEQGIHFETRLSWKQIQDKAKAENKYIFMDCYTTWCGPCRYMEKNIYPLNEVGDFYNQHFICIKVQMDRTNTDGQNVKDWYVDSKDLSQIYKIDEYPTYLYFSPAGEVVHKETGSTENAKDFIKRGEAALDINRQNFTLLKEWRSHKGDSLYLFKALSATTEIKSDESLVIEDAYIALLKRPLTKGNIVLFTQVLKSNKEKAFALYVNNIAEIDRIMGANYAERVLSRLIYKEAYENSLRQDNVVYWKKVRVYIVQHYPLIADEIIKRSIPFFETQIKNALFIYMDATKDHPVIIPSDWENIHVKLVNRFPGYDINKTFLLVKLDYCSHKNLNEETVNSAYGLLKGWRDSLGDGKTNDIIFYDIFNMTGNPGILKDALKWMKICVTRMEMPDYHCYDTYANLLYKTGSFNDAIDWENKALKLAIKDGRYPEDVEEIKSVLGKMNNGEKTWSDNTIVPEKKISNAYN